MSLGTKAPGPAPALPTWTFCEALVFELLSGPALLPLGREKPAGGVSQRKRETKNSSPGEQAHFILFLPLLWGVGQRVPFLSCSRLLRPNHALLFGWHRRHRGPSSKKGPRVGKFCSRIRPGPKAKASGLFVSWFLICG